MQAKSLSHQWFTISLWLALDKGKTATRKRAIGISNRATANWWKDKYLTTHLVKDETGLERYPEKNIQSANWIDVDI